MCPGDIRFGNITELCRCVEFETEDGGRALSFRFESIISSKITTPIKSILMDFELAFKLCRNFKMIDAISN